MTIQLSKIADTWERAVDRFAYSPWSSLVLWIYAVCWLVAERGNIGWDGWATIAGIEVALSIRRWQERS